MNRPLGISRGRRFGCTACGNCCVEDGYVFFKAGEMERIADHLGLTIEAFVARFGVKGHPEEGSPVLEAKDGRGCPLLTADRKCSVHAVKPSQCATWPFWPDMVSDRELWDASKTYCPGLDKPSGRLYSRREILAIVDGERGTGAE